MYLLDLPNKFRISFYKESKDGSSKPNPIFPAAQPLNPCDLPLTPESTGIDDRWATQQKTRIIVLDISKSILSLMQEAIIRLSIR